MKTLHKAEPAVAQILAAESLNNHTYKAGWKHLHPKPIIFCSCRQPYFTHSTISCTFVVVWIPFVNGTTNKQSLCLSLSVL